MAHDPHDVVRVAAADLVTIELYQQALAEAGIKSNVVGTSLGAGVGTALQNTIELWVHADQSAQAAEAIRQYEAEKGTWKVGREEFERPEDSPPHRGPEGDHFPGTGRHNHGDRGH